MKIAYVLGKIIEDGVLPTGLTLIRENHASDPDFEDYNNFMLEQNGALYPKPSQTDMEAVWDAIAEDLDDQEANLQAQAQISSNLKASKAAVHIIAPALLLRSESLAQSGQSRETQEDAYTQAVAVVESTFNNYWKNHLRNVGIQYMNVDFNNPPSPLTPAYMGAFLRALDTTIQTVALYSMY